MADYKNLKDWVDTEKLTGIDYTYERTKVTEKLEEVNTNANIKGSDLFVLSDTPPPDPYINIVWFDPSQFKILASLSSTIHTELTLQGYSTQVDIVDADVTINPQMDLEGFKIEGEKSIDVPIFLDVTFTLQGYKEQIYRADFVGQIDSTFTLQGYKQLIHTEDYNEGTINTNVTLEGYKQLIVQSSIDSLIQTTLTTLGYKNLIVNYNLDPTFDLNLTVQGYKNQIENLVPDATINTTLILQGYKNQLEDIILTGQINSNFILDGYKNSLEDVIINDHIFTTVTLQGYKNQQEEQELVGSISGIMSLEGYKVVFEELDITIQGITPTVTLQGYKVDSEELDLDDSISATATLEGLKKYDIFATSNVPFSGNFLFSVNYNAFPASVSSDMSYIMSAEPGQFISFNAPPEITEGSVKYQLDTVYYTIGGVSTPTYPVQLSQMPYQLYPTARINVYFNYREVPVIPVSVKATDISVVGSQFFPNINLYLKDENGDTIDSTVANVDQTYTQHFSFEDADDYTLQIVPQSHTSGSNRVFTPNEIRVYYYNQDTTSYELMYSESISPIDLTIDPDTTNLLLENYDREIYVDARYTSFEGSFQWSYAGSGVISDEIKYYNAPGNYGTSCTPSIEGLAYTAVVDWLTQNYPPSNYPSDTYFSVYIRPYNSDDSCVFARYKTT